MCSTWHIVIRCAECSTFFTQIAALDLGVLIGIWVFIDKLRFKLQLTATWVAWWVARHMDMDTNPVGRLPLTHPLRIKARDLKLQRRDEERARRNGLTRYRCPCNLCGGRRRPYNGTTVARHLRNRGRHGALRGWTPVKFFVLHVWVGSSSNWACTI